VYVALDRPVNSYVLALDLTFHHSALADVKQPRVRNDISVNNAETTKTVVKDDISVDRKSGGKQRYVKWLGFHAGTSSEQLNIAGLRGRCGGLRRWRCGSVVGH
jgi:hypothetical protein